MSDWPILSTVTFLPLVGVLFVLTIRGDDEVSRRNIYHVALWTTAVTFILSLVVWGSFDSSTADFQLVEEATWLGGSINYRMGVDGISVLFVVLTAFLMPICIIASKRSVKARFKEYMIAFLVLETLMIGVFCALDLVLFYVFFEGGLIPMFLIIGVWGGARRVYASFKFFLYTLAGSVLMLLADPGDVLGSWHHEHHRPPQLPVPGVDADMAMARLLRLLRGEDADVAGAHLAAGRACRGADRRFGRSWPASC